MVKDRKKVLLIGYQGKLGSIFYSMLNEDDSGYIAKGKGRDGDLDTALAQTKPDIVIDVSDANSVYNNSLTVIKKRYHLIIGASGLSNFQLEHIHNEAKSAKQTTLHMANFSLSTMLMFACLRKCAHYFDQAHVLESHHIEKIDKPSQSAKATKQIIEKVWIDQNIHEEVEIASRRSNAVMAENEVFFSREGESLTLVAKTQSRKAFINGLKLALKHIERLPYGLTQGLDFLL